MAGQLIKRGGGRWLLRVYRGRDAATGARAYKSVTFRGDRNQARAELDRLLRRQDKGPAGGPPSATVDEHLDQWFERVAANHYSYKTFENYKGIIAYDVRSLIGRVKLSELEPRHVQKVLTAMRERGVCSNTRRRFYSVLSTALDSAVVWGTLEQNPAAQVQIPRRETKEMRALTREEARRFLAVTDAGRWAEFFRAAVVTGMRPGELIGLRWDDVDFEHSAVSVQRSLVWKGRPAEGWLLVLPKTKRGLRQIAVPRSLTNVPDARPCGGSRSRRSAKPGVATRTTGSSSPTGAGGRCTRGSSSATSSRWHSRAPGCPARSGSTTCATPAPRCC
jgi:hypothetical protein